MPPCRDIRHPPTGGSHARRTRIGLGRDPLREPCARTTSRSAGKSIIPNGPRLPGCRNPGIHLADHLIMGSAVGYEFEMASQPVSRFPIR
jgi:hypothetical protein